jgi:hypothetical protein
MFEGLKGDNPVEVRIFSSAPFVFHVKTHLNQRFDSPAVSNFSELRIDVSDGEGLPRSPPTIARPLWQGGQGLDSEKRSS